MAYFNAMRQGIHIPLVDAPKRERRLVSSHNLGGHINRESRKLRNKLSVSDRNIISPFEWLNSKMEQQGALSLVSLTCRFKPLAPELLLPFSQRACSQSVLSAFQESSGTLSGMKAHNTGVKPCR